MTEGKLTREFVLAKCAFFLEAQLWPLHQEMHPERWLSNFLKDELDHAVALLNAFVYLRRPVMAELLLSAFQGLSRDIRSSGEPLVVTKAKWRQFVDTVLVTCVRGENPNATDSGFHFLRMARQIVRLDQSRIVPPEEALPMLLQSGPRPVVFVDDFVGSGRQFISTWKREVEIGSPSQMISFERYFRSVRGSRFIYCPLICTAYGKQAIERYCAGVSVNAAHVLSPQYSAIASNSVIWPKPLANSATSFLETASLRAGIAEWRGFHNLALALGFEHSVPDATLPIFYWDRNGWIPLIQRT